MTIPDPAAPSPQPTRQHIARVRGGIVILDVARDRYEGFPIADAELQDGEAREDAVRAMADIAGLSDIAVTASESGPPGDGRPAWLDLEGDQAARLRTRDVLIFAAILLRASIRFHRRSFQRLVETAGRAPQPPGEIADYALALARFERLCLFLPVRMLCLFRSHLLLAYLRAHGLAADWIFGVSLYPFHAHCWIAVGDHLVGETTDRTEDLVTIMRVTNVAGDARVTRFVALRWAPDDAAADARSADIRAMLLRAGWVCPVSRPGWCLLHDRRAGHWTLHRSQEDEVVVIGRLFDRRATEAGHVRIAELPGRCPDFAAFCAARVAGNWGGYIALHADPRGFDAIALFRDPVGTMDCATWTSGGLRIVASHPELVIAQAPPAAFAIDWSRLTGIIARPVTVSDRLALSGIETVPPGTILRIAGSERSERRLWSPLAFAMETARYDGGGVGEELVDACVAAWTSRSRALVAELSGGLDSAIVAAGAVAADAPVRACFNYHAVDPGGDERRFAQATADRLGLPLETIFCPDRAIGEMDVDTMPAGMRLGFGRTNIVHDADLARRATALGADMLLTGNGGDSVFFQHPSPLLAAELRTIRRPFRAHLALLMRLARWTGEDIWSLAAIATGLRRPSFDMPDSNCRFLSRDGLSERQQIGWMENTETLPPTKRLHILHLSIARSSFGPSWCGERLSVVHPLMSQPILEHVLPIPALALTQGRCDRALARDAYASRLPAMLIERRGKGCLTAYLGRRLAASTTFLRSYLLDGILASQRVIDPLRLEPILSAEHLMRNNDYGGLLLALLAERWARVWSERIRESSLSSSPPVIA